MIKAFVGILCCTAIVCYTLPIETEEQTQSTWEHFLFRQTVDPRAFPAYRTWSAQSWFELFNERAILFSLDCPGCPPVIQTDLNTVFIATPADTVEAFAPTDFAPEDYVAAWSKFPFETYVLEDSSVFYCGYLYILAQVDENGLPVDVILLDDTADRSDQVRFRCVNIETGMQSYGQTHLGTSKFNSHHGTLGLTFFGQIPKFDFVQEIPQIDFTHEIVEEFVETISTESEESLDPIIAGHIPDYGYTHEIPGTGSTETMVEEQFESSGFESDDDLGHFHGDILENGFSHEILGTHSTETIVEEFIESSSFETESVDDSDLFIEYIPEYVIAQEIARPDDTETIIEEEFVEPSSIESGEISPPILFDDFPRPDFSHTAPQDVGYADTLPINYMDRPEFRVNFPEHPDKPEHVEIIETTTDVQTDDWER